MTYRGFYLVNMVVNKNGQEITYIIGYIPQYGWIGIGTICGDNTKVYIYDEHSKQYMLEENGEKKIISQKICTEEAFKIFRLMVVEQLI